MTGEQYPPHANRPQWPDVDMVLGYPSIYDDGATLTAYGLRAINLSPDTDWDLVEIRFDNEADWRQLGPGAVLRPEKGEARTVQFRPAFQPMATRLYDATAKRNTRDPLSLPNTPPAGSPAIGAVIGGWAVNLDGGDGANYGKITNASGAGLRFKWTGVTWVRQADVGSGYNADCQINGYNAPIAVSNRPADWSPDGRWSFADYIAAGLLPYFTNTATKVMAGFLSYSDPVLTAGYLSTSLKVSAAAFDNHGIQYVDGFPQILPTSSSSETTFASRIRSDGSIPWGPLSTFWQGSLGVELWIDEDPPVGFRPTLAPARVLYLPCFQVPTVVASPAGTPATQPYALQPLLTVPAINVERVQWTIKTLTGTVAPGGVYYFGIGSPLPNGGISFPAGVQTEHSTNVVADGMSGAAFLDRNAHPFAQLLGGVVGGPGGWGALDFSTLTLIRRVTQ